MRHFVTVFSVIFLLSGCANLISKVVEEPINPNKAGRTMGADIDDKKIETFIAVNLIKADPGLSNAHINTTSYNGLVLLSGEVSNSTLKTLAGDVAREFRGVRQVYNELRVQGKTSIVSRTNDALISGKIKAKLAFKKNLAYKDFTVVTEDSVVYLLGTVRRATGDVATEIARNTSGVKKVVKCFEYVD